MKFSTLKTIATNFWLVQNIYKRKRDALYNAVDILFLLILISFKRTSDQFLKLATSEPEAIRQVQRLLYIRDFSINGNVNVG